jgi:SP family myo-inositol transporter-like MFS transporter 13
LFSQTLLIGYNTGIISAVLVVLNKDPGHELDSLEKELITSITPAGAFLGALVAGLSGHARDLKNLS